ncbi:hypothetical protein LUZ60_013595 [Juncus effusus]|nr:hypothetical protein LUZ60_013595 [Juncus effusus]
MAEEKKPARDSYSLFSDSSNNTSNGNIGFGFFSSPEKKPPPPPSVEVPYSETEISSVANSSSEPIVINDSLTLYKGRASTSDVFGVRNSDLVPGKYEGGLKLWEGSIDLVKTLFSEIKENNLSLKGKRVLEIGCGHGLPGIFTALEGAKLVHFQDFNAEVLKCLTIPNVKRNTEKEKPGNEFPDLGFFAGDWSEVHKLLLCENNKGEKEGNDEGYDVILMAETVYDVSSLDKLFGLIKKCLKKSSGVVYMAGKKYYFGVGGGTRQFIRLVEQDGSMEASIISEVADGSSNVREVWKLSYNYK